MIIRRMPLFWRLCAETPVPDEPGIPTYADFEIAMNAHGVVQQVLPANLRGVLERIYTTPRTPEESRANRSKGYYAPFMKFLHETWRRPAMPAQILDMGCGDGALLPMLKEWSNAGVLGVELSPPPGGGLDIRPVPPRPHEGKLDLIVHHHVLEHAFDPHAFLDELHALLADDGMMIFAVPDCTESIELGDPGMALHQHVSYFDEDSLRLTLALRGFRPVTLIRLAGTIFCAAVKQPQTSPQAMSGWNFDPKKFETDMARNIARFRNRWAGCKGTIGMYVPLRAIPYLTAVFPGALPIPRYFDDGLAGSWIDGLPRRIEDIEDLVEKPVDTMFIVSLTHGDAIEDRISRFADLDGMQVITLREILTL